MTIVEFRSDNDTLVCEDCQHLTTWLECRLRQFNELRCGRCGGPLKPFKLQGEHDIFSRDPEPPSGGSGPGVA